MGREAVTVAHWDGQVAKVKLHLDSHHLQLRGDIRADFPRSELTDIVVDKSGLTLNVGAAPLVLAFPAEEASRWQKALLKAPPTLAQKLGVSAETPAFVQGGFVDAPLSAALEGATVAAPDDAAQFIAIATDQSELEAAETLAAAAPAKHIWMVYRKGKVAVGGTTVRAYLRGLGYRDSKSCAVSDLLTATRYRKPQV